MSSEHPLWDESERMRAEYERWDLQQKMKEFYDATEEDHPQDCRG